MAGRRGHDLPNLSKEDRPHRRGPVPPSRSFPSRSSPVAGNNSGQDIDQDADLVPRPLSLPLRRPAPAPIPQQQPQQPRMSPGYTSGEYTGYSQRTGQGSYQSTSQAASNAAVATPTAMDSSSARTVDMPSIADIPQPLDLKRIRENRLRNRQSGNTVASPHTPQRSGVASQYLSPPPSRRGPPRRLPGPLAHGAPTPDETSADIRGTLPAPQLVVTSPSDEGEESDKEPSRSNRNSG